MAITNLYYLYRYGGNNSYLKPSSISSTGQVWSNTALGAIFDDADFGVDANDDYFDFLTSNTTTNDGFETDGFDEFYLEYKSMTGSDLLSYLNGYCDTSTIALGDMKNVIGNTDNNGDGVADDYYSNISIDYDDFAFFKTYDGDLYRFVSNDVSFSGGNPTLISGRDQNRNGAFEFNLADVDTDIEAYYDFKVNQLSTAYGQTLTLDSLDLDWGTVTADLGTTDLDTVKVYYQRVIDQMVDELKQIKPMTISKENEVAMMKELEIKQSALKAIDDELFGYRESTVSSTIETGYEYSFDPSNINAANKSDAATVISNYGGGTTPGASTLIQDMLDSFDVIEVETTSDYGATVNVSSINSLVLELESNVSSYIGSLALDSTEIPSDVRLNTTQINILDSTYSSSTGHTDYTNTLMDEIYTDRYTFNGQAPDGNTSFGNALETALDNAAANNSDLSYIVDVLEQYSNYGSGNGTLNIDTNADGSPDYNLNDFAKALLVSERTRAQYVDDILNTLVVGTIGTSSKTDTYTETIVEEGLTTRSADTSYIASDDLVLGINDASYTSDLRRNYPYSCFGSTNLGGWEIDGTSSADYQRDANAYLNMMHSKESADGGFEIDLDDHNNLMDIYSYLSGGDFFGWDGGAWYENTDKVWVDGESSIYVFKGDNDDWRQALVQAFLNTADPQVRYTGPETPLEMRHLKSSEDSIVKDMADYLLNDVNGENGNVISSMQSATYLAEVTSAIMENYWIENYNNDDAPSFYEYFENHFYAYVNPDGVDDYVTHHLHKGGYLFEDVTLNFDMAGDHDQVNIIESIMGTLSFAQMAQKFEERTRLEMEIFEMSAALDTVLLNNQEYMYRLSILSTMEKQLRDTQADGSGAGPVPMLDFSAVTESLLTIGCPENNNPFWAEYFPWFKGFYGNMPEGATVDDMFDESGNLNMSLMAGGGSMVDPYIAKINGVDYVMGIDQDNNGVINDAKEILGITDTKENLFESLYALDKDNDGYISQSELKENNIIFDAVNMNHRFNNATIDTDFVRGIDLATVEEADGTDNIFGNFNVELTNGKKVDAIQTFQSQAYFNNLFGSYVDLSFVEEAQNADKSSEVSEAKQVESYKNNANLQYLELTKQARNIFAQQENSEAEEESIENQDVASIQAEAKVLAAIEEDTNIENFTLIDDGEEVTVSKLIDSILWSKGITKLTSTQRYDLLGTIDIEEDFDIISRKLEQRIDNFNLAV